MAHPAPPPPPARTDPDAPHPRDGAPWDDPPDPDDVGLPDEPGPPGWRDRLAELRARLGLDVRLVAWAVAAVAAAGAAAWLLRPAPAPFEETLPRASTEVVAAGSPADATPAADAGAAGEGAPDGSTTTVPTELVAHAAGAVGDPGLYRLDPAARVDDLVRAAGGLAPDADAARLNLAAPLVDGARVYVPRTGEESPPPVAGPDVPAGGDAPDGGTAGADAPAALVDINTADEAALDELPGVGPAIAGAIIGYRTENGGFSTVDELLEVRGIGEAKLAEIAPLVTV
ncbi:helix-hairpin-helix domain-containing protein [Iamia majanohamensis]|uniref:Helix-hairpin-helix domain-containing protein n=1 Tax=Iamia majanohamensis TaxID=467976 RepID=A0AAE9Y7A4_9ACTN|nr:helix-hairpin-helix domain-containing protein [Iamia majanohamensis]WCO65624.1 helix-hairpin-helix domain-containing protein [Iamia majanohamensis]